MNKYQSIKDTVEDEIKKAENQRVEYETQLEPYYRASINIASPIIKRELQQIGTTFFGSSSWNFLSPKKFRVEDFRFKNNGVGHVWQLDKLVEDNYIVLIMIAMDHDDSSKFRVRINRNNASYAGLDPDVWFKVIVELGKVIELVNLKLQD